MDNKTERGNPMLTKQEITHPFPDKWDAYQNYAEKRRHERFALDDSIIYSDKDNEYYFRGRSVNYSREGLCFTTSSALKKGEHICLLKEDENESYQYYRPGISKKHGRAYYIAEVRWCRKESEKDTNCYTIGVRFHKPLEE